MKQIDVPLESASLRHKALYDIFIQSHLFRNMVIKQEVSVKDLVSDYKNYRQKVDWYIQDLNIAIELMGKQHRHITRWGNIPTRLARMRLFSIKSRDSQKKTALENAGITYVAIWYDEELSVSTLMQKIQDACS